MNQLELLRELENKKTILEDRIKEHTEISNDIVIKNLTQKAQVLEKNIAEIKNSLIHNDLKLNKNNKLLTDYDYEITEMRKQLYGGTITDLEQLDYLNKEKEKLKEIINNIETDILTTMDNMEIMEVELVNFDEEMVMIKNEIETLKEGRSIKLSKLEKEIKHDESELDLIEKEIDLKLLDRFYILRNTRQNSVVEVKDGICTGCNMRIPTFQIDIIKEKNEIVYCQSCGRILYLESKNK